MVVILYFRFKNMILEDAENLLWMFAYTKKDQFNVFGQMVKIFSN